MFNPLWVPGSRAKGQYGVATLVQLLVHAHYASESPFVDLPLQNWARVYARPR